MGRPPTLPEDSRPYAFRLPASVMARVDAFARRWSMSRSEAFRALVERGLFSPAADRPPDEIANAGLRPAAEVLARLSGTNPRPKRRTKRSQS